MTKPSTKAGYNNAMKTEVYGATAEMNLQTHTAITHVNMGQNVSALLQTHISMCP